MHLGGSDVNSQKQPSAPCDSAGLWPFPVASLPSVTEAALLPPPGHFFARSFLALQGAGGRG